MAFLYGGIFALLINVSKVWRTSGQPDGPPISGAQAVHVLIIALVTGSLCGLVAYATKRLFPRRR
jgi:hypothetical protein